jgi:hypothetical protein
MVWQWLHSMVFSMDVVLSIWFVVSRVSTFCETWV